MVKIFCLVQNLWHGRTLLKVDVFTLGLNFQMFDTEKHSSLFCQLIYDKEKSFVLVSMLQNCFRSSPMLWQNKLECFSLVKIFMNVGQTKVVKGVF